MNKKGFTLIEIILTIAIMGLLSFFIVISVNEYREKTIEKLYNTKINTSLNALYELGNDVIDYLDSNCTNVKIGELIELGYLEGDNEDKTILINPIDNSSMNDKELCVYYKDGKVVVSEENIIENTYQVTINLYKNEESYKTINTTANDNSFNYIFLKEDGYNYKNDVKCNNGTGTIKNEYDNIYSLSVINTINGDVCNVYLESINYSLSYNYNGGEVTEPNSDSAKYDEVLNLNEPTKLFNLKFNNIYEDITIDNINYYLDFIGWSSSNVGENALASFDSWDSWNGNVIKTNKFKNLSDEENTVYIEANWSNRKVNLPSITKKGYICNYVLNGVTYNQGDEFILESNKNEETLSISCNPRENNVNVYVQNGSASPASFKLKTGKTATVTISMNEGYSIDTTSITCTEGATARINGNELTISDVTADTICNISSGMMGYYLSYDLQGGSAGDYLPGNAIFGNDITISNPAKEFVLSFNSNNQSVAYNNATLTSNFTFNGWTATNLSSSALASGNSWNGSLNKSTNFKNLRDSSGTVYMTANWSSTNIILPTITKSYYTCGFSESTNGSIKYSSGGTYTIPENASSATLYAKCEPNTYTVNIAVTGGYGENSSLSTNYGTSNSIGIYPYSGYTTKDATVKCNNGTSVSYTSASSNYGELTISNVKSNDTCTVTLKLADNEDPTCTLTATSSYIKFKSKSDNVGVTAYGLSTSSSATYNSDTSTSFRTGTFYGYVKDAAGNTGKCSLTISDATTKYTKTTSTCSETVSTSYTKTSKTCGRSISSYTCSSGTLSGSNCILTTSKQCLSGGSLSYGYCYLYGKTSCSGWTINKYNYICYQTYCPYYSTRNACLNAGCKWINPGCQAKGTTGTTNSCPSGTTQDGNMCKKTSSTSCASGYLQNSLTYDCKKAATCPTGYSSSAEKANTCTKSVSATANYSYSFGTSQTSSNLSSCSANTFTCNSTNYNKTYVSCSSTNSYSYSSSSKTSYNQSTCSESTGFSSCSGTYTSSQSSMKNKQNVSCEATYSCTKGTLVNTSYCMY